MAYNLDPYQNIAVPPSQLQLPANMPGLGQAMGAMPNVGQQREAAFMPVNSQPQMPPQQMAQQPMMQQPQQSPISPNGLINQVLQQYLQTKRTQDDQGGLIQSILSNRMQPNMQDAAKSTIQTAQAYGAPDLFKAASPEQAMNDRITGQLTPYSNALGLQKQQMENDFSPYTTIAKLQESNTTSQGGATGALINRVMQSDPSLSFQQALQLVQTGYRSGTMLDNNGNIIPIPGSVRTGAQQHYANSAATQQGAVDVKNQNALPGFLTGAQQGLDVLDSLIDNPNLKYAVGPASIAPTIPGTPQADIIAKLDQIKGQQFLSAYNSLRGGGSITEVEGDKATDAMARIQRSQSVQEFNSALRDLRGIVSIGIERAKAQAAQSSRSGLDITGVMQTTADPGITLGGGNSGGATHVWNPQTQQLEPSQ